MSDSITKSRVGGTGALALVGAALLAVGVYSLWFTYTANPSGQPGAFPFGASTGIEGVDYVLLALAASVVALSFGVFERTDLRADAAYPLLASVLLVCLTIGQFVAAVGTEGTWTTFTTGPGFVVSLWGGTLLVAASAVRVTGPNLTERVTGSVGALVAFAVLVAIATFAFEWVSVSPSGLESGAPPKPDGQLVSAAFVLVVAVGALLGAYLRANRARGGKALFLTGVAAALLVFWRTNRLTDGTLWYNNNYHMRLSVPLGVLAASLLLVAGALLWDAADESETTQSPFSAGTTTTLTGAFGGVLFLAATRMAWSINLNGGVLSPARLAQLDGPLSASLLVAIIAVGTVLATLLAFTERPRGGVAFLALGVVATGSLAYVWVGVAPGDPIVSVAEGFISPTARAIGPGLPVAVCGVALLFTSGALLYAGSVGVSANAEANFS